MDHAMPRKIETLDYDGLRLLRLLVSRLSCVTPDDPRTYISYKEVHDSLGLKQEGGTFGESLKNQGLNSLAEWSATTGKPGITGLIIDKSSLMPGDGYFRLFGRKLDDFNWWRTEIEKSISFPWEPYVTGTSVTPRSAERDQWSEDELRASVAAYLEMQHLARSGTHFTKKEYYKALTKQFGRTIKAFEYRMQNISYVMSLMGRNWLPGLKPAKNVGANIVAQIEELISEIESKSEPPVAAFKSTILENAQKKQPPLPNGSKNPTVVITSITQYQRDTSIKTWVLKEANGTCECCQQPAPFRGVDGLPYLEIHHVRMLAKNGTDTTTNAVAVCPNCHRELHYGSQAGKLVKDLYRNIQRLRRE